VADIKNCRLIVIDQAKTIVKTYGQNTVCGNNPPATYGSPNGDTPLPNGNILVTQIWGHEADEITPDGRVLWRLSLPVTYASDTQPTWDGNIEVVDYSGPGQIVVVDHQGNLLWRYGPTSGEGMLDHPSLGLPLPGGDFLINDDYRHRVIVVDPRCNCIVWQYGVTDVRGTDPGYLNNPDGVDVHWSGQQSRYPGAPLSAYGATSSPFPYP
jgi:hypothetical protein